MSVTPELVQAALKNLVDPNTKIDFVSARNIKNLRVEDGDISLDIVLGYPAKSQFDVIRKPARIADVETDRQFSEFILHR